MGTWRRKATGLGRDRRVAYVSQPLRVHRIDRWGGVIVSYQFFSFFGLLGNCSGQILLSIKSSNINHFYQQCQALEAYSILAMRDRTGGTGDSLGNQEECGLVARYIP